MTIGVALVAVLTLAIVGSPATQKILSDADLLKVSKAPFNKAKKMGTREQLGRHKGVPVIAEYRCGDLCPGYTVRIIRYDVLPGSKCDKVGGITRREAVPIAAAVSLIEFCIPVPIVGARD